MLLGSTGSIGKNSLEVIRREREAFQVLGLSAHQNIQALREQIREFQPRYISVGSQEAAKDLEREFPGLLCFYGREGLRELASVEDYDILLTAVSGAVGIEATVKGIELEKRIALANKETMVSAGPYINHLLKTYRKAEIVPVDSEHSAIFQCLQGNDRAKVKRLILTASGGPFRGKKREELERVGVRETLQHPNWSMGKKISVDSATLVNKGLEIIEAHELFGVDYDKIEAIIHPQSIIHSMVEYEDRSILAQMGVADMKLPIQYALHYPHRSFHPSLEALDFSKMQTLSFEEVNEEVFRGISLAKRAGKAGGTLPAILNAANELAVDLFLAEQIRFLDIYDILERAITELGAEQIESLEHILAVDEETRRKVKAWVK